MSGFRPIGAATSILGRAPEKRPALKVVTLPPSAFADTWDKRPKGEVKVGLRLVSDETLDNARASAAAAAWEVHGDTAPLGRIEAYNETLVRTILAHACVKDDDVRAPFFGAIAESLVAVALTDAGVLALWEGYERLKVETSPLSPEATDSELQVLAVRLADGTFVGSVSERDRTVLRRLLRHVIDEAQARAT